MQILRSFLVRPLWNLKQWCTVPNAIPIQISARSHQNWLRNCTSSSTSSPINNLAFFSPDSRTRAFHHTVNSLYKIRADRIAESLAIHHFDISEQTCCSLLVSNPSAHNFAGQICALPRASLHSFVRIAQRVLSRYANQISLSTCLLLILQEILRPTLPHYPHHFSSMLTSTGLLILVQHPTWLLTATGSSHILTAGPLSVLQIILSSTQLVWGMLSLNL